MNNYLIPYFIESSSPSALRALMLKTNLKARKQFQYFNIGSYMKRDKLYWIAWYYAELEDE